MTEPDPGDIIVTPVPSGHLIGEALLREPGPWWTYIALAVTLKDAVEQARALARQRHVRLWFWESPDRFREIALDDSAHTNGV